MSVEQDEHQTTVQVEGASRPIYIGEDTIAAIRGDAITQLNEWLDDLAEMRAAGIDPLNEDTISEVRSKLSAAEKLADTLVFLSPPQNDDEEA